MTSHAPGVDLVQVFFCSVLHNMSAMFDFCQAFYLFSLCSLAFMFVRICYECMLSVNVKVQLAYLSYIFQPIFYRLLVNVNVQLANFSNISHPISYRLLRIYLVDVFRMHSCIHALYLPCPV